MTKIIQSESGRSMVEMLGVLAIIGVLSITGLYGYQLAIRKVKANEVANVVTMFYTQAMALEEGNCKVNVTATDLKMDLSRIPELQEITMTECPGKYTQGSHINGGISVRFAHDAIPDFDEFKNAVAAILPSVKNGFAGVSISS